MMNTKFCDCGCGNLIPEINKMGKIAKFLHGHNRRGMKHPNYIPKIGKQHYNWKGGITKENGYILVRSVGHPKADKHGFYLGQHILVMEKYIGRYLNDNEVVHHKNGIRDDNRIENLQLLTRAEHTKLHWMESER